MPDKKESFVSKAKKAVATYTQAARDLANAPKTVAGIATGSEQYNQLGRVHDKAQSEAARKRARKAY